MEETPVLRLLELKSRRRQARRQLDRQRRLAVLALLCLASALLLSFSQHRPAPPSATSSQLSGRSLAPSAVAVLAPQAYGASARQAAKAAGHCPIPPRYRRHFVEAASRTGVPLPLLTAVAYAESRFKPKARSKAGAVGLFQLMPDTARGLHVDPYQPRLNISGGAQYLHLLLVSFHGSRRLAVAAYNAGPTAVRRYGGVPPYSETRSYVDEVLGKSSVYDGHLFACR